MVEFPRYSAFLFCPDNRNSKTLKILTLHLQFNKVVLKALREDFIEGFYCFSEKEVQEVTHRYEITIKNTSRQINALH
ncbi:TPA: hypothetical protein DCX15_05875 [bacterium]|nr:hypothetical protein [bacterium]